MRRCSHIVLLLGLAWLAAPALAQQEPEVRVVTIVNADSVAGQTVDGERLRRLFGNVHLRQDDTDLRAARATQHLDRDLIIFEGNVRISDETDTLRAARVSYDSRTRIGEARGNVRLSDAEAVLYSDSLIFYRAEKRAVFQAPVRLIERDGGGVLTSLRGTYFTDRKEAFFEDDVRLEDSTSVLTSHRGRYGTEDKRADFTGEVFLTHDRSTRLRADSLTHFRDSRVSEARGHVAMLRFGAADDDEAAPDTTRRTLLFGGYAFHDEDRRYSRFERGGQTFDPLVARLHSDEHGVTDTLLVRAARFEVTQLDSLETGPLPHGSTITRIFGRRAVRMAGQQLAAVADSAVVDRLEFEQQLAPTEDDIRLYLEPMAWLNSRGSSLHTQVSGEALHISARDDAIDTLRVLGRAFAVRPDSAIEKNNQIRGRQMLALFRDDSLRAIRVWSSAEALFFRADSLGQLDGGLKLSGDSLSFTFDGEDLRRIGGVRDIEGEYHDAAILPNPFRLDGPAYIPDDRPSIAELLEGRPPLADPFTMPPQPPLDLRPPLEPEPVVLEPELHRQPELGAGASPAEPPPLPELMEALSAPPERLYPPAEQSTAPATDTPPDEAQDEPEP